MEKLVALALLVVLSIPLATLAVHSSPSSVPSGSGSECIELYFLNSIKVFNTSFNGVLYLETPQNISFGGGLVQKVYIVMIRNLVFNESSHYTQFSLKKGEKFFGYFVARVELCGINMTKLNELETLALANPYGYPRLNASIPKDVKKFLGEPPEIVVKVAKPAFEKWFDKVVGGSPSNFSKLVIALYAAQFVKQWIKYVVSPYPRPLKVIVEKRIGDCDDMSRLLIALLWSYGIPAVLVEGYVVIWGFEYRVPVENTLYVFHNSGPHAFVLAYAPGYGWIPIDFLAGSLTTHPFVFEGYTTQIRVNKTAVEEFKNVSKQINAVQIFYIFNPAQYSLISANLEKFIEELYAPYNKTSKPSQRTTPTHGSASSITSTPKPNTATKTIFKTVTITVPIAKSITHTVFKTITKTIIKPGRTITTTRLVVIGKEAMEILIISGVAAVAIAVGLWLALPKVLKKAR